MTTPRRPRPATALELPAVETAIAPGTETSAEPVITNTDCRQCGTQISGIHGRYSCGVCGWANHWSEGHNTLPTAADDHGPHAPKR